jgi:uncharacterized protein (DUF1800 family)
LSSTVNGKPPRLNRHASRLEPPTGNAMAWKYFTPFSPSEMRPFDRKLAAHLLRRAGFGAPPQQVAAAVEAGLEETIESLFDEAEDEQQAFQSLFEQLNGRLMNFADGVTCQAWWVNRMVATRVPLREKLTLFWHGHFATSINKVGEARLMMQQIDTLRQHAWGNFRDLVLAVARDPAMLVWLDSESSTKEHPNENFARELMELFTCGIGNYTEQDVLEAARAFTGWHRNGNQFVFNAEAHDFGTKTILGKRGKFNGQDVIDILMAHPATPKFIARKLLRFFACSEPEEAVVAEAAEVFDRCQLNVKWFLRELFLSEYFYSQTCYRQRITSPVELVVGTVRTLGVRLPAYDLVYQQSAMGQELLAPPNVKGWDGEQKWIHSTSLAARSNFARTIAELNSGGDTFSPHCPIESIVPPEMAAPDDVVARLVAVLFDDQLPGETRREVAQFLITTEEGSQPDLFRDDLNFRQQKTRELLSILLSLPEYQAC